MPLFFAIFAFLTYAMVSGKWDLYKPWFDSALLGLCTLTFISIWLG